MAIASDKLVFLHIPKTGGMWVSHAMKRAFQTFMVGHQHTIEYSLGTKQYHLDNHLTSQEQRMCKYVIN